MKSLALLGVSENEVTPEHLFFQHRRQLLCAVGVMGLAYSEHAAIASVTAVPPWSDAALALAGETTTALRDITSYNNYYEFSTDKKAVRTLAQSLSVAPWRISIEGEVQQPYTVDADELFRLFGREERIYRLRCVEGWSMVVPWSGFPLRKMIDRAVPTSRAKYVEFESLQRSSEMIGQRNSTVPWPYREGLRIDEAMHPLAFAVTGLYGQPLPKQNGAPLRVVLPWKYGYKSSKAITRIRLLNEQPATTWSRISPSEYGFYGNVNPSVAHPRWSQARETRVGELQKRATLLLNGYADDVAELYTGLDSKNLY